MATLEKALPLTVRPSRVGISFWQGAWRRFKNNKAAVVSGVFVLILLFAAAFAPWVAPYAYDAVDYTNARAGPSFLHPFGTDNYGRDMLSRLIYSLRTAVAVALGAQFFNVVIGVTLGAIAGYYGGKVDNFLMRISDMMFAFPSFLFSIVLVAVLGRGPLGIILAIAATSWVGMTRLVRGEILSLKQREFVEAARALGASGPDIILRYLVPNALAPIIVSVTFGLPSSMTIESGLSLLGLGVRAPMPSWGILISEGAAVMRSFPHLLFFPAATFAITLITFTYLGDGLNDALNPRE
jgi:ABC-type dipeptide/oligopeptide/nickel transport system permease subunit